MKKLNGTDMIYGIVAMDIDDGIGKDNRIPWNIPEDFRYFMQRTKNSTCIMGKNTYLELVEIKRARLQELYNPTDPILGNRKSIVLSSTLVADDHKDCRVVNQPIPQLLQELLAEDPNQPIYILGGPSIFKESMPFIDELSITIIPDRFQCTEFFPRLDVTNHLTPTNVEMLNTEKYGDICVMICKKK